MARKAVVDAVRDYLAANWSAVPVVEPNTFGEAPEDGTSFVMVQYPVSSEKQITLGDPGNNVWREEGGIRIVINAERGKGLAQGTLWADQIAALFRGKEFDGVRTSAASSAVIDDRNDEGNFFSFSIVVSYSHDLFG